MDTTLSEKLTTRAARVIPGGVNSPVRAFGAVGGTPVVMKRGSGCYIDSVDETRYVDFCASWGPLILGHAHPEVVDHVCRAVENGMSFGTSTEREIEMAETLCTMVPSMDAVRLVNSGTEATMTALRIARGVTKRPKIIKFDGCYHGHSDQLLVAAGSGLLTGGIASSAGVPESLAADVHVLPYNDVNAVEKLVHECGTSIAAIIVEPIAGNMGLVPPHPGFLQRLRDLTTACGAVLIFDEVITGFRLAPTTYANHVGIIPDLTCLGKIIGGGMPIGAVGGRRELMEALAPIGGVYQAGTLSGNPVAVAAGLATIRILKRDAPYSKIEHLAKRIADGVNTLANDTDAPFHCIQRGSMFTTFFCRGPVTNLATAKQSDCNRFKRYFHHMLRGGFYLSPSQFEVGFVSAAHRDEHIESMLDHLRTWTDGLATA